VASAPRTRGRAAEDVLREHQRGCQGGEGGCAVPDAVGTKPYGEQSNAGQDEHDGDERLRGDQKGGEREDVAHVEDVVFQHRDPEEDRDGRSGGGNPAKSPDGGVPIGHEPLRVHPLRAMGAG
jgi:hypothetical protein